MSIIDKQTSCHTTEVRALSAIYKCRGQVLMSQAWLRLSLGDQMGLLDALPPPFWRCGGHTFFRSHQHVHSSARVAQNVLDVYTCTYPQTPVLEGVAVTPFFGTPSVHTFRPRSVSVSCAASISALSRTRSQSIGAELEVNNAQLGSRKRNVHVHFDRGPRATRRTSNRHDLQTTMRGDNTPPLDSGAHANEYTCTFSYSDQAKHEKRLPLLERKPHTRDLPYAFPSPLPAIISTAISCARATAHPKRGADGEGSRDGCDLQRQLHLSVPPARAQCISLRSAVDITYDSRTGGDSNQSARCTLDGHVHVRGECSRKMIRKLFRYRVHRYEAIAITSSFAFILDLRLCAGLEGVA